MSSLLITFDTDAESQPNPLPSQIGENGTLEYSSIQVGETLVALFFALVRNIPENRLVQLVHECFEQANISLGSPSPQESSKERGRMVADLFTMIFQTRDCRGGKGERSIFYQLLIELSHSYPQTVIALLPLIAEYGYYKDYYNILDQIGESSRYEGMRHRILDLLVNQLLQDESALSKVTEGKEKVPISLCAKYAPRESHQFQEKHKELFKEFLFKLYPDCVAVEGAKSKERSLLLQRAKKQYRQLITKLTAAIDVPEVKMCGKRFAEIDFGKVPSLCLKKYRKAFANESIKGSMSPSDADTGNRHPNDPDRVLCREHLLAAVKSKKVKGKQLFPHDIVHTLMRGAASETDISIFQAQWEDIRSNIMEQIRAAQAEAKANAKADTTEARGVDLGQLVPMVDVSGSMSGTPMEVAIALGILISEVNHPHFRDRFITFETTPQWVDLSSCSTIADKVRVSQHAPWGGSTNIEAAFQLIEQAVERHRIPEEEIPALIIFSDMQFDQALGYGAEQTQLQRIESRFAALGKRLFGKPFARPRIIFWNLRGDTKGFPVTASSNNVQMLSGFSPALFKHLVDGSELSESGSPSPYDTFRKAMDDERYEQVRRVLGESNEGYLAHYTFVGQNL